MTGNYFKYQMRFRPTWPLMDTMPIVQGMLDNLIEQEGRDLIVALGQEIERLKQERPGDPVIAKLEESRQEFIKIWGDPEPPASEPGPEQTPPINQSPAEPETGKEQP